MPPRLPIFAGGLRTPDPSPPVPLLGHMMALSLENSWIRPCICIYLCPSVDGYCGCDALVLRSMTAMLQVQARAVLKKKNYKLSQYLGVQNKKYLCIILADND